MDLRIENKLINPGVINLTQFSAGTDTLTFELENSIYESLDFKDDEYTAYAIAILPTGKMMDKIELTKNIVDKILKLTWKVTNYTTKVNGTLTYQIVFENSNKEIVWYSNNALMFVNSSINADDFLTANYPTLFQQWLLKMEQLKILIQECTGVPIEGLKGQYLRKRTNEDFDCEWVDIIDDINQSSEKTYSNKKIEDELKKKMNKKGGSIEGDLQSKGIFPAEDRIYNLGEAAALWNILYLNRLEMTKMELYRSGDTTVMGVTEQLTVRTKKNMDIWKPVSASAFNVNSSKRYKENIRDLTEEEANKIDELETKIFDYKIKENGINVAGLIAEDVYKIFPDVVTLTSLNGKKVPDSIDYSKLIVPLIKKVQLLENRVATLENKN